MCIYRSKFTLTQPPFNSIFLYACLINYQTQSSLFIVIDVGKNSAICRAPTYEDFLQCVQKPLIDTN